MEKEEFENVRILENLVEFRVILPYIVILA